MLKVAILGFGFMGKAHANAYERIANIEVVAIGGCREERLRDWNGHRSPRFVLNAADVLKIPGIDILDICLPTFLHEEFVIRGAQRGMHVICEKPLAFSASAVDRMFAAVEAAGITFMVAQVLRFFPHYAKSRQLTKGGDLGNIFFASASRLSRFPNWASWFREPQKSGGAVFDLLVHDVDYMVDLLGLPDAVYATGLQSDSGSWDHVASLLSFGNRKVSLEASYKLPESWPFSSRLRLMGTAASLEYEFRVPGNVDTLNHAQHSLVLYPNSGKSADIPVEDVDPYYAELRHFVEAVENKTQPSLVPHRDARPVVAVLEATKRSLETGKPVPVKVME